LLLFLAFSTPSQSPIVIAIATFTITFVASIAAIAANVVVAIIPPRRRPFHHRRHRHCCPVIATIVATFAIATIVTTVAAIHPVTVAWGIIVDAHHPDQSSSRKK